MDAKRHQKSMKIEALGAQRLFFYDFGRSLELLHFSCFRDRQKAKKKSEKSDTLRLLGAGGV